MTTRIRYFAVHPNCCWCRTNSLTANNDAKEMELGLFDGEEDTEHIAVGFVEISIIILFEADWAFLNVIPFFSSQLG